MNPLIDVLLHCIKHGCRCCGEKPTPATVRNFTTHVTLTADGEVDTISHICRKYIALEN